MESLEPDFHVIVATCNYWDYIQETMDSVLAQIYTGSEIVRKYLLVCSRIAIKVKSVTLRMPLTYRYPHKTISILGGRGVTHVILGSLATHLLVRDVIHF